MSDGAPRLRAELGLGGAVLTGLGSILGTGVFVSIGIAAGVTGPSVVVAVALGALVATANGLSSAQLAAVHPVSGGTYEYGYRFLTPVLGFTAGWTFLLAKSASAATAALGFGGYLTDLIDAPGRLVVPLAVGLVVVLTLVVLTGLRRSTAVNTAVVAVTLAGLGLFVAAGLPEVTSTSFSGFFTAPEGDGGAAGFLEAVALMFVAYTGYGRIATLGEEVRRPRHTIPRAIVVTLAVTMVVYVLVAFVAVGAGTADALAGATGRRAAPLQTLARDFGRSGVAPVVAVAAVTAMAGVLLNLILGLSRVLLAMGRRRDVPPALGAIDRSGRTPVAAVVLTGVAVAAIALVGDVGLTWSFSAFAVLVYYALTNLAALRLDPADRLYPRWISWAGLAACAFLAWWVDPAVWLVGLVAIAAGLAGRHGYRRWAARSA
jgi:basic amino acid/polyamine antiporter, APA family